MIARLVVLALIPALPLLLAAAPEAAIDDAAFLAGGWQKVAGDRVSEELWTEAAGGTMLGVGRTIAAEQTRSFEFLRIEQRDVDGRRSLVYIAQPGGGKATEFTLQEKGDGLVVFANPQHDFPQTIRYELKDGRLHVAIAGETSRGPRRMAWVMEPVKTPSPSTQPSR